MPKKKIVAEEVIEETVPVVRQELSREQLQKLAKEAVDRGVYSQTFGKNSK